MDFRSGPARQISGYVATAKSGANRFVVCKLVMLVFLLNLGARMQSSLQSIRGEIKR